MSTKISKYQLMSDEEKRKKIEIDNYIESLMEADNG